MKKFLQSEIVTLGLAIFSMLFGAGNLMYPLAVGMSSGTQNAFGITAFMITAICLPLIGIITMILYKGNYEAFFARLGTISGKLMIFICMLILGPVIAMPRIITLSHTMMTPFLPYDFLTVPSVSASFVFAIIFLLITFVFTYRENKIVDILGLIVSPALLVSLFYIIVKGILYANEPIQHIQSNTAVFFNNLIRGYETLDLIGALFFSSIILNMMRTNKNHTGCPERQYALVGLKSGLIGTSLLGLVYIGMSILGVYHGRGLENVNSGELFREISLRILGGYGTFIVALAVLLACLSTAIALAAVIAEYTKKALFNDRISYVQALVLTLLSCIPLATAGLGSVLALTAGPITFVGYPTLITLTLCNMAHKLWGFNAVRIPVLLTFFISLAGYFYL
jgi:LIVCS family branched-chain amino acid:cation transporter